MSTVEVLKAGRARIAHGWAREAMAYDADGEEIMAWAPEACRFCAMGAIQAEAFNDRTAHDAALKALEAELPPTAFTESMAMPVAYFNDTIAISVDDVLALYDRAIAKAEQGA